MTDIVKILLALTVLLIDALAPIALLTSHGL
jgi:hypothetical protein